MPNVLQRARTRSNPSQPAPAKSKPRSVSSSSSNSLPRVPIPVSSVSNPAAVQPGYQHLNTSIGSLPPQSKPGPDGGAVSSIHSSDNQSRARASSISSSGNGHGGGSGIMRRSSSRKRPPTPIATGGERVGAGLGVAIEVEPIPIPLPTKANQNAASVAFPAPTPPFASQGPHQHPPPTPSPTLSARPPNLSSSPSLGEGRTVSSPLSPQSRPKLPSSSTSGPQATAATMTQGLTSSTTSTAPSSQRRKPSLASPLPPTPLVPPGVSTTPMRSQSFAASNSRTPPAPLNLSTSGAHVGGGSGAVGGAGPNTSAAGAAGHGHGHVRSHYNSLPGPHSPMGGSSMSMSTSPHPSRPPSRHSPHPSHSQLSSPYAAHGHQPHSHSPLHHPQPRPHTSSSPHPHTSPPIHTQAHHQQRSSLSLSSSPSGLFPQPPPLSSSPTNLPDSPSARAMMKRLLAKPAPPSSASGGSVGGTPTSAAMNFGSSPGGGGGGGVGWMSATSGSESEGAYGYSYRRRKDLGRMFGAGDGRSSPALYSPGGAGAHPISPSTGMGVDGGRRQTKGWKSEPEDVGPRRRGRGGFIDEEKDPNITAAIEFDMNLERLDRGIATLGLGVVRGPGYPAGGGGDGADAASPREKEKKTRNVLRRRPSANAGPPSSVHSPSASSTAPKRSASAKALSQIARAQTQQLHQAQLQSPAPAPTVLLPPTSPLSPISFSIANRNSPSQPSQPSFEALQMHGLRPPVASSSMSRSSSRSRSGEGSGRSRGSSPVRSPVVSTIHGSGPGSGSATPVVGGVERKRSREERLERLGSKEGKLERKGSKEKERGLQRKLSKDRKEANERTKSLTPAASLIEQYKARQATREEEERRVREALEREAEAERVRERERWERERAVERAAEREEKERIRALERERAMERNERERRADWEKGMGHQRKRSRSHPAAFSSMSIAPVTTNTSPFSSSAHVKAKTSLSNFQTSYAGTNSMNTHLKPRTTSDRLAPEHDTEAEASDSGVSHLQLARRGGTPAPEAVLGGGRGFESIERIAGREEHERRMEEMVQGSKGGVVDKDDAQPPNASERRSSQNPPREGMEDQPGGPYYTVFGSTSGRVVAVGSVEDSWDAYGRLAYWDSGTFGRKGAGSIKEKEKDRQSQSEKGEKSKGLGRTLSRKVSERWRRPGTGNAAGPVVVPASVMSDDGHGSRREEVERERQDLSLAGRLPRASMQERRVPVRREEDLEMGQEREKREKMKNHRSLRLSIDKFSDVVSRGEERDAVPLARTLSKQKSSGAMKDDAASPASAGPSRLWKLMRRISVGGLRDKYQDSDAPPVPALPHHLREGTLSNDSLKLPPRKAPSSGSTSPSPTPVRQSPTAGSSSRPSPPQSKSNSAPAPSQPRPSTATRSSSPVSSSDVASSKFFNRTHSTRSSTSSLGEEVPPPVPKAPSSRLTQKIIPPSKMDEISKEYEAASSQPTLQVPLPPYLSSVDGDWAIVDSPAVELPSLTLPPRRPQQGFLGVAGSSSSLKPPAVSPLVPVSAGTAAFGKDEEDVSNLGRSESPTIPLFSTTNTVDTGPAKRLSASLSAKSKSPPISPHSQSPSSANIFTLPVPGPTSTTSLPPPPRPLRSAQRPPPGSLASQPTTTELPISEPTRSFPSPSSSIKRNRRSSGGTSTLSNATARPHRRSSSIGMSRSFDISRSNTHLSSSSASIISSYASIRSGTSTLDLESAMEMGGRAAFTFRELGSSDVAGRRALTEQEKAARWDDLLERSDRAGGTLHLGGEGRLASDRLRF